MLILVYQTSSSDFALFIIIILIIARRTGTAPKLFVRNRSVRYLAARRLRVPNAAARRMTMELGQRTLRCKTPSVVGHDKSIERPAA